MKVVFAGRLKAARLARGFNQQKLADRIGVTRSAVSKFEAPQNDALPSADVLSGIARTLRVSIDYLLGISDFPQIVEEGVPVYNVPPLPGWLNDSLSSLAALQPAWIEAVRGLLRGAEMDLGRRGGEGGGGPVH
jgi:transcriptional regulator with XRE-family HTH domain